MRISRDEMFIQIARIVARRGTCNRAQVGAVIVKDSRIISIGYNGSLPGEAHCTDVGCKIVDGHCIRTIHAEANAICWAARNGVSVKDATMYVSGWTICPVCNGFAQLAGIKRIIADPDGPQRPGGY